MMEDPEKPGWFLCSNGELVGINHQCPVRGEEEFFWNHIHTDFESPLYCGACKTRMSKTMEGFYKLCAWDK